MTNEQEQEAWEAFQTSPTGKGLLAQFGDAWAEQPRRLPDDARQALGWDEDDES